MRRILRKIAEGEADKLGDTSTLADPSIVEVSIHAFVVVSQLKKTRLTWTRRLYKKSYPLCFFGCEKLQVVCVFCALLLILIASFFNQRSICSVLSMSMQQRGQLEFSRPPIATTVQFGTRLTFLVEFAHGGIHTDSWTRSSFRCTEEAVGLKIRRKKHVLGVHTE